MLSIILDKWCSSRDGNVYHFGTETFMLPRGFFFIVYILSIDQHHCKCASSLSAKRLIFNIHWMVIKFGAHLWCPEANLFSFPLT